jgi:putative transposase
LHFICRVLGYSKPWLYTWLKRDGLAGQRPYQPRGTPYPALAAQRPNQVHPLDLVGPRYLKGGERFYGVQLMDAYSNAVALAAMPSKQAIDVVEAKELIKNG